MTSEACLCLVTGATHGIGAAVARQLAEQGARVILHGRDSGRLLAAAESLRASGHAVDTLEADFTSLDAVGDAASRCIKEHGPLDVLINNAGALTDHRQTTAEGFERTFGVNYLAPALLTRSLLAGGGLSPDCRVIHVSSSALGGGQIDFSDLQSERAFNGWQAYANSKLANLLFSNLLAEQFAGTGRVSNALCPGLVDTNFFHTNTVFANGEYERMQPMMRTAESSAELPLWLATDPAASTYNGRFFLRRQGDGRRPLDVAWDRGVAERLWALTDDLLAPWLAGEEAA